MSAQTVALVQPTSNALEAALPAGYVVGQALSAEDAGVLTQNIQMVLGVAQDLLRIAFQGKAHEALGYGKGLSGWEAYFAAKFADVVTALPQAQRQLEVAKWNAVGASVRATATALGVSTGTVSADRKVVGTPENVVSLDGRRRDAAAASVAATAAVKAKPAKPLTARIEEMLLAAGATGLTSREALARIRGAHHGQVSPVFTALKDQRRAYLTGDRREGYGVHVHPQWLVIDAEVVEDAEVVV